MSARLPSQPVWPRPRRTFYLTNLNLSLLGGAALLLVGVTVFFSAGASMLLGDQPLTTASAAREAPAKAAEQPVAAQTSSPPPIPASSTQSSAIVNTGPRLQYREGSSTRLEQLIGDVDVVTGLPTTNLTKTRYGITGTDLGYSFEHNGKLYFLFGDTMGPTGGDVVAVSTTTDPNGPLKFDMLTDASGNYLMVDPPYFPMDGYEVPVSGISVNGSMYVVIKSSYLPPRDDTVASVLTRYDEASHSFSVVRWISSLPGGHFITPNMRLVSGPIAGLTGDGPWVLMFGSGDYRNSSGYLAAVPASNFEKGDGTRYFAGSNRGTPIWSDKESEAKPIIDGPDIGDISVTYVEKLGVWVALYDSLAPRGIIARYASQPWGPWSPLQVLYEPSREPGYGVFLHDPSRSKDDGLAGPIIEPKLKASEVYGGFYAPYIIDRFTQVNGDQLTLHYVMSTWNPYYVVHMKSTLTVLPYVPPPEEPRVIDVSHPWPLPLHW